MNKKYLTAMEFHDFQINQDKLIEILNHNMSKIKQDIKWMKVIGYYMAGVITAMGIKFIGFS